MDWLIVVYFLFFIFLVWKNFKLAVLFFIALLPGYLVRFDVLGIPTTLIEVMFGILFLYWVFAYESLQKKLAKIKIFLGGKFLVFLGLFFLGSFVGLVLANDILSALGTWKAYFVEPILFLGLFVTVFKRDDLGKIFKFLGLSVLGLSLFAIYQFFTGQFIYNTWWASEATRRVTSFYPYPNALALYLVPVLVLVLGACLQSWQKGDKKQFFGYGLVYALGALAVFFTRSKGAIIVLCLVWLFYLIVYFKQKRIKKITSMMVFLIFISSLFFLPRVNWQGFSTVEGGGSVSTRVDMWRETVQMLKVNIFSGVGLNNYQESVAPFHKKDYIEIYLYPHNIVFNFWSEIGVVGLLGFLGMFVVLISRRAHNKFYPGRLALWATVVYGLVDVPFFKNDLAFLWFVVCGLMFLAENNNEDSCL